MYLKTKFYDFSIHFSSGTIFGPQVVSIIKKIHQPLHELRYFLYSLFLYFDYQNLFRSCFLHKEMRSEERRVGKEC